MNRCVLKCATAVLAAALVIIGVSGPVSANPLPPLLPEQTTTTTTVVDVEAPQTSDSSPGLFDVSGKVRKAIDDWFASLVSSAITPTLELLGRVLLQAPDLTDQPDVRGVWLVTLGIADALFIVFATVGGVTVMMHDTVQSRYSLKEIAPRLVLAVITANISLIIVSQAITLANALALGFLGEGIDTTEAMISLGQVILDPATGGGFLLLLGLAATIMAVLLVCIGLVRAVLVVLLIVGAPLALACHALPQTDGIASLWWRALAAVLSIQIAQALVLVTAIKVLLVTNGSASLGLGGSSLVLLLVTLCVFWIMLRIPIWAERIVFGARGGPVGSASQRAWVATRLAVKLA